MTETVLTTDEAAAALPRAVLTRAWSDPYEDYCGRWVDLRMFVAEVHWITQTPR